jgi:hypothetical protein
VYRRILKSIALSSLAAFIAAPALAQISADIGGLHIRIASDAPPGARHEQRPPRLHQDDVWINGYWDRRGDRWEWSTGRWERPVNRQTRWVNPRYTREGNHYRYDPGHWSNQRLSEGEDYQQWRREQEANRNHPRD